MSEKARAERAGSTNQFGGGAEGSAAYGDAPSPRHLAKRRIAGIKPGPPIK